MNKVISFFSRPNASRDSFEQLVSPYMALLFRQAYKYTGSSHDAEDLVQDLLVNTYRSEQKFREAPQKQAWLMRCLYNRFVDRYRKLKTIPPAEDIDQHDTIAVENEGELPEGSYWHRQILQSLDKLNAEQRVVVVLHDIEGHTLNEVSETLMVPLGTLKSQLHRARKLLQKELCVEPSTESHRYKG